MFSRIIVVIIILLSFYGCTKNKPEENVQTNASLADSLRLSSTSVQIGSDSLILTSYVWRDFMPGIGKDGSGLYCSNQLNYKDSLLIPFGLEFRKQYIINGNQVWTNEHPVVDTVQTFAIRASISGGPKWGPDILVDVVCEFAIGNKNYTVIARQQKINATF